MTGFWWHGTTSILIALALASLHWAGGVSFFATYWIAVWRRGSYRRARRLGDTLCSRSVSKRQDCPRCGSLGYINPAPYTTLYDCPDCTGAER